MQGQAADVINHAKFYRLPDKRPTGQKATEQKATDKRPQDKRPLRQKATERNVNIELMEESVC